MKSSFSAYRSGLIALGLAALLAHPAMALQTSDAELPDQLFADVGTVLTVQVPDHLSSNKNSSGDQFVAVLRQPLVIDGWVVARRGQTVFGTVTSANSAGRVKGTSDLIVELTEMVLVDGQQAPIRTQLLRNYGEESRGEDAVVIAGAGAIGAAIGAAIGGGKGALIGVGIGAGAATAGVLSTRGKAAEIHPETTLTFRLDAPLVVSTRRSQHAFLPVAAEDYDSPPALRVPPRNDTDTVRSYEPRPDHDRYPRAPRYPGPRIGVIPPVILLPPPIIVGGGRHGRRY